MKRSWLALLNLTFVVAAFLLVATTNPVIAQSSCVAPDMDGDGTPDSADGCVDDPAKIAPGNCGCGRAESSCGHCTLSTCGDVVDPPGCFCDDKCALRNDCCSDVFVCAGCGNGLCASGGFGGSAEDCTTCPNDCGPCPAPTCTPTPSIDTDGDGTPDSADGCPNDPAKIAPGHCGCGVDDTTCFCTPSTCGTFIPQGTNTCWDGMGQATWQGCRSPLGGCFCDETCADKRDCCPDYEAVCGISVCGDFRCDVGEDCGSCPNDCCTAATPTPTLTPTDTPTNTPMATPTATPTPAVCGNGLQQAGEECDDSNVLPDDGCSATCTLEPCVAAPIPGCLEAAQAQLAASEKTAGKEKLKLQWKKVTTATTQGAFGDPVTGTTRVALCLYSDTGTLLRGLVIDQAAQSCSGKPCWAAQGTKGYAYKDNTAASDGISKMAYGAGDAGKGQADAAGANNAAKSQTALPTGVVTALSGNTQPTIQLVTSDGFCVGATMTEATKDDGLQYKARKK